MHGPRPTHEGLEEHQGHEERTRRKKKERRKNEKRRRRAPEPSEGGLAAGTWLA
jgi:hypothetical protein